VCQVQWCIARLIEVEAVGVSRDQVAVADPVLEGIGMGGACP
jgi:hypothetical protein